jgi:hypothetical protein
MRLRGGTCMKARRRLHETLVLYHTAAPSHSKIERKRKKRKTQQKKNSTKGGKKEKNTIAHQHILVPAHDFSASSGYTRLICSLSASSADRGTRRPSPEVGWLVIVRGVEIFRGGAGSPAYAPDWVTEGTTMWVCPAAWMASLTIPSSVG